MKRLLNLLLLLPALTFAQEKPPDFEGVWKGVLYNDTTKQFLQYELAISEKNERLSAFSYTVFVIDKKDNIGVKSLNVYADKKHIDLEDKKLVYDNYPVRPAKGVKTMISLDLTETNDSMVLSGPWHTNSTKEFISIHGSIRVAKIKPQQKNDIIPKLVELGYANQLSFLPPNYDVQTNTTIAAVSTLKPKANDLNQPAKIQNQTSGEIKENQTSSSPSGVVVDVVTKKTTQAKISAKTSRRGSGSKEITTGAEQKNTAVADTSATALQKKSSEQKTPPANTVANVTFRKTRVQEPLPTKVTEVPKIQPAAKLAARKTEMIRSVEVKQDSIILSLYDNGEIDGDTVSVVMNGQVIMPMQRLMSRAINKTIYWTPELGDSILLVMYAENLGSIPPNTGLLVVRDGEDIYEIRFSGDYQKNSAIILKRKKKLP